MSYDTSTQQAVTRVIDYFTREDAVGAVAAILDLKPWQAKMYVYGYLGLNDPVSLIYVISRVEVGTSSFIWLSKEAKWETAKDHFLGLLTDTTDPARVRLIEMPIPTAILDAESERVDAWFDDPSMADLIEDEIPARFDVVINMADAFSALPA